MQGSDFEIEIQKQMIEEHEDSIIGKQQEKGNLIITCYDDLDEKLQELPRTSSSSATPPQTTVLCNLQHDINEVASTISHSSASTSYKSFENYSAGDSQKEAMYSVAI